ncbi:MAG: hypothetical protein WCV86_01365 [Patescibacteria group bacterium]
MEENQPLTSDSIQAKVLEGEINEAQERFITAVEESQNIKEVTTTYEQILFALAKQLRADLEEIDREQSVDLNEDTLSILAAEKQERIDAYNKTVVALAQTADDTLLARGLIEK